jgi:hypothetical protein
VVIAETQQDVVAAVRACAEFNVPFVARGSGTSLSGGSVPVANGIVIALNRLTKILRLDPAQRLAVVEPGVVNFASHPRGGGTRAGLCAGSQQPADLHPSAVMSPSMPAARIV